MHCNPTLLLMIRMHSHKLISNKGWQLSITDRGGMGIESRELAAGVDGDSGVGAGLDGIVMQWRGRV
jgi:hypothetical protein